MILTGIVGLLFVIGVMIFVGLGYDKKSNPQPQASSTAPGANPAPNDPRFKGEPEPAPTAPAQKDIGSIGQYQYPTATAQTGTPTPLVLPETPTDLRLLWRYHSLVTAYLDHGKTNPYADQDAVNALYLYACRIPTTSLYPTDDEIRDAAESALKKGSTDPVVRMLFITFKGGEEMIKNYDYFAHLEQPIQEMNLTKCHPYHCADLLFTFSTDLHNAFFDTNTNTIPSNVDNACKRHLDEAMRLMPAILADKSIPRAELYNLFLDCEKASASVKGDRKILFDELMTNVAKIYPDSAILEGLKSRFYTDYAWDARGTGFADKVSQRQQILFNERLELATQAVEKGYQLDPTDASGPREMISIIMGMNQDQNLMSKWFKRAVTIEPENYKTYHKLMYSLTPRWGGSAESCVGVGKQCLKLAQSNPKKYGHLARMLVDAHQYLSDEWDWNNPPNGYWTQGNVWSDLDATYQILTKLRPNSRVYRSEYALAAWRCQQWQAAHDQFKLLGDKPVYSLFGGLEEYEKAVKTVNEKLKTTDKF